MKNDFLSDVLEGFKNTPKSLPSKYFYNAKGDALFQDIMKLPEYYLTDCEFEIFREQGEQILKTVLRNADRVNLIELGAGDGYKTKLLLDHAMREKLEISYMPVDISENILNNLQADLEDRFPGLRVKPLNMDFFEAVKTAGGHHAGKNVILFLGSTAGNLRNDEVKDFFDELSGGLNENDEMLIGFDLQKDPRVILAAYNDSEGITKAFNLNLIERVRDELNIEINPEDFVHYPSYDPVAGAARSFLLPRRDMEITIGDEVFSLKKGEPIHCETSRKFKMEEIEQIARQSGFVPVKHYIDKRRYYVDSLWRKE